MRRGRITKRRSKLVAVWLPAGMAAALDEAVAAEDSDRSKFVRRAIRNRITALGGRLVDGEN